MAAEKISDIDPADLSDRELLEVVLQGLVELAGQVEELNEKLQDRGLDGEGFEFGRFEES